VFPRLIACDLDGTLLRSDGTISQRTRQALASSQAAGADIVLCTARPVRWVRPLAGELGVTAAASACDNGAVLWDLAADQLLTARTLAPVAARGVVDAVSSVLAGGSWAMERPDGFAHEPGYQPHWPVPPDAAVDHIHALLAVGDPPAKLMFRNPGYRADAMLGPAREAAAGRAEVTHSNSAGDLLEISAPGVNKATALADLCAERSVTADAVIAFGDMPNDLEMLQWAGRSVAVAGAHPDVIAAAGELTTSNDDDGVARVVERALADANLDLSLGGLR
jgi:hypothetical protein